MNKKAINQNYKMPLHLFAKLIPVQILSLITVSLCSIINTLIINNSLGASGLSQMKVVDAVTNLVFIFQLLLTSGEVLFINRAVCQNEQEQCNAYFNASILISVLFGVAISALCLLFPAPICSFFGADSEMLTECCNALRGIVPYYILFPLCSVFLSLFQIRSDLKTPIIASLIVFVSNISLNYIFLTIFNLGIFYSALATSLTQFIVFIFILIKYKKAGFASFSFRSISLPTIGSLVSTGCTESASRIWSVIKASFMTKIMAAVGGAQALASFSIIGSIDAITFGLFSSAIQMTTLMVAGIYINEGDRNALRRFAKTALITAVSISVVLCTIMFFSANFMASLYHVENSTAHVTAQHIYAFAFLFYLPNMVLVTFYAALDKKKLVNTLSLVASLIVPLTILAALGNLFGINAFWLGMVIADSLSLIITLVYTVIHNKRLPRSIDDLLCLDETFGVPSEDTFSLVIHNTKDATDASEKIMNFCQEKQIDRRLSYFSSLCLEEIAVNIVTHGFRHTGKKAIVELVVVNHPEYIKLIIRDTCNQFDPYQKLSCFDEKDITKGIGIRLVTKVANTAYKNMYGLNIITMTLDKQAQIDVSDNTQSLSATNRI